MAYRSSSSGQGNSTTLSVTVPTGVANDDIILLAGTIDRPAEDFSTKWPAGFTNLAASNCSADGQSMGLAWKRASGESGSYTLSAMGGASYWVCAAAAWSGRSTSSPPTISTVAIQNTGQSSPVSVDANGLTASANDDLCMISLPDVKTADVGNGHTAPSGYTERLDIEEVWSNLGLFTLDNVSAGATGTVSASFALTSSTAGWVAYLVRIPVAGAASNPSYIIRLPRTRFFRRRY